MSPTKDRLLQLVRAAGEEAVMQPGDDPRPETLVSYLRGELSVEKRLEIQRALLRSETLRQRLLELADLQEEEALERFDAEPDPAIPAREPRRHGQSSWRRRRIFVPAAAAALLLVASFPLLRSPDPPAVDGRDWNELSQMRTEQFEPSVLRGRDGELPELLPSPRLALSAALLRALSWEEPEGWRVETPLPEALAARNGTAVELEQELPIPTRGVALFDLDTRILWSHELTSSTELPRRFAFPGPASGGWVLLRWWRQEGGFAADVVAGAL